MEQNETQNKIVGLFIETAKLDSQIKAISWLLLQDKDEQIRTDFEDVRRLALLESYIEVFRNYGTPFHLNGENLSGESLESLEKRLTELKAELTAKGLLKPLSE